MPRANQPLPTKQLDLFPPSCPGPDRTSLPKEALETAARLMARMLVKKASNSADGANGGQAVNDKIQPHHLGRKAVLYVRQSSPYQVAHNRESRALQYAMQDRLRALGWSEVEIVDDDLGCSAAGTVTRAGFERMVADVCLGKVGAVAAREVSRFARNSRDWQQLIEMCRVVDTLLVDQEAVYAPRQGNDQLLLGLKGSLNEYELDLLRQRSLAARQEMARRGELVVQVPVGYIKADGHRLEKDPDRRVQEAITLVFSSSPNSAASVRRCCGSSSMAWICRPVERVRCHLEAPLLRTLYRILTNPVYGGAYAYGKTASWRFTTDDAEREDPAQAAGGLVGTASRRPRGLCRLGTIRSDPGDDQGQHQGGEACGAAKRGCPARRYSALPTVWP